MFGLRWITAVSLCWHSQPDCPSLRALRTRYGWIPYAIKAAERKKVDAYARRLKRAWEKWSMDEGRGEPFPLPDGWRDSAEQFRTAGLEPKEVERLIEVAMTKEYISDRWRYFCGCCWRVIRERQEIARALIETDGDAG